jgi:hypothetical protein
MLQMDVVGCLGLGLGRADRRMVVGDLPLAPELVPHIREASINGWVRRSSAQLEHVHARVEVCVAVIEHGHAVIGDGPERVLLHEGHKVLLSVTGALDVLWRKEERKLAARVELGWSLVWRVSF